MQDAGPVIVSTILFLVVGTVFVLYFINRHKERMTMLEKGFSPEQMRLKGMKTLSQDSELGSLKWGIIALAIGLAILTGMFYENVYGSHDAGGLYPGLIFIYAGVGLVVYYILASKKASAKDTAGQK